MPPNTLIESQWSAPLPLTDREAAGLRAVGERLAGSRDWWGRDDAPLDDRPDDEVADDEDGGSEDRRSVIGCVRAAGGWRVRVHNAVGLVAVGEQTLQVQPKIPTSHYLHLLERARVIPRRDTERVGVAVDDSLWSLVARWYLTALGDVVKADLIRDYREEREVLPLVRGRINALSTTRQFYKGRIAVDCTYEEFDVDNPLNRVLKAAARVIVASILLERSLRRDGVRLLARLDSVGDLRPGDLAVQADLRTQYYADALQLARHVLLRQGRTLHTGAANGWSFLIPSPNAIEAGVRAVLQQGLADLATVTKRGKALPPSRWTLNPDLVFNDGNRVGDVKYSLATGSWSRAHIYQATTFATGYRTNRALVVGFRPPTAPTTPADVRVGDVTIRYIAWDADPTIEPETAADALVNACRAWLVETTTASAT